MAGVAFRGLLVAAAALALAAPAHAERFSVLANDAVRVGVDLDQGGKITWLSRAHGEGADNLLLQSVQSYYSGPYVDGAPAWHAVNDLATTVASSNDGRTIYTRAVGSVCECAFEQWVALARGSAIVVRNRLTSFRSDANDYEASRQELPALYTLPPLHRALTYDGAIPYRGAQLREITPADGGVFFSASGPSFAASEHWAALVDDDGFGIGLFTPDRVRFNAIAGGAGSWPGGYLTAPLLEQLDANVVYEYSYTLVVGSVEEIRAYAVAHRPDPRPRLLFRRDRQHVVEANATDLGFPIEGALRVRVDRADPQLVRQGLRFDARNVPRLYVRGAWHTRQHVADLFWAPTPNDYAFSDLRHRPFVVVPDGRFHSYRVDLAASPSYRGLIGGLRLDPVADAEPGGLVDVTCISWKPCPIDRRAERALLTSASVPFIEPFDRETLNDALWFPPYRNPGTTVGVVDGELEVGVAGDATLDPRSGLGAGVTTRCTLTGDFDVSVDYRLLEWPEANGVNVNLSLDGGSSVFRSNTFGESVGAWFPPFGGTEAYAAPAGTLRLARSRGVVTASYRRDGAWVLLRSALLGNGPQRVTLSIWVDGARFARESVRVAFDNLRVTRGRWSC